MTPITTFTPFTSFTPSPTMTCLCRTGTTLMSVILVQYDYAGYSNSTTRFMLMQHRNSTCRCAELSVVTNIKMMRLSKRGEIS